MENGEEELGREERGNSSKDVKERKEEGRRWEGGRKGKRKKERREEGKEGGKKPALTS